jgi:hypothetical protein
MSLYLLSFLGFSCTKPKPGYHDGVYKALVVDNLNLLVGHYEILRVHADSMTVEQYYNTGELGERM